MKRWSLLSCLWLLSACAVFSDDRQSPNIVLVIGDGMGMEYISAYRYFSDDSATEVVEWTLFDQWLVGTASTYPHDRRLVTDSAAAATALAAGIKTYNGAIGMDADNESVETVLERAKRHGYHTGLVATSQINHATPASFAAHTESRNNYVEIANQYLDNRHRGSPYVDLLIGGGRQYFVRDDRDLVEAFQREGYQYTDNLSGLDSLSRLPAVALVADLGMSYAIDSEVPDRLARMTWKALQLMDTGTPFFLMVEASQVDWCGHANDIVCAMAEMADTEQALKVIHQYVDKNPNTLVVVTADHSTGGLSIGTDGKYTWEPQIIRRIMASATAIAKQLINNPRAWREQWDINTALPLDEAQHRLLQAVVARAAEARNEQQETVQHELVAHILAIINARSGTGWTSSGHTGGDVPVMAFGLHSNRFQGTQDNTDIAKKLFRLLP